MAAGARCERFPTEGFLALAVHPWRFPRWENSGPTRLLSLVAASSRREHPHPEFAAMVGLLMYLQLGERPASFTSMAAKPLCGCSFRELAASMPASEEARPAT